MHPEVSPNLHKSSVLVAWLLGSAFFAPMVFDTLIGVPLLWLIATAQDLRRRLGEMAHDGLFLCVLALLLLLGLSVFWSREPTAASHIQVWLRIVLCLCVLLTVSASVNRIPGFQRYLCRTLAVVAVLSILLCLWIYAVWPYGERMQGLMRLNNSGRAGHAYSAALPFLLAGAMLERGFWRYLAAAALPVTALAVFLTDSRIAWMAGGLGLLTYGVTTLRPSARSFPPIMAGLLGLFGLLILFTVSNPAIRDAILPRGDSFRLNIWSANIREVFLHSPWLGQGIATEHWLQVGRITFRGAHSMYLSAANQVGIAGLSLFLATLLWTGIRLLRNLRFPIARLGLSLLVTGGTVFTVSGDRLVDKVGFVWFALWFPVAVALALGPRRARDPLEGVARPGNAPVRA